MLKSFQRPSLWSESLQACGNRVNLSVYLNLRCSCPQVTALLSPIPKRTFLCPGLSLFHALGMSSCPQMFLASSSLRSALLEPAVISVRVEPPLSGFNWDKSSRVSGTFAPECPHVYLIMIRLINTKFYKWLEIKNLVSVCKPAYRRWLQAMLVLCNNLKKKSFYDCCQALKTLWLLLLIVHLCSTWLAVIK